MNKSLSSSSPQTDIRLRRSTRILQQQLINEKQSTLTMVPTQKQKKRDHFTNSGFDNDSDVDNDNVTLNSVNSSNGNLIVKELKTSTIVDVDSSAKNVEVVNDNNSNISDGSMSSIETQKSANGFVFGSDDSDYESAEVADGRKNNKLGKGRRKSKAVSGGERKRGRNTFTVNDRTEMVKLIYDVADDKVEFQRGNNTIGGHKKLQRLGYSSDSDDGDDDGGNEELMTSRDSKPLLGSKKKLRKKAQVARSIADGDGYGDTTIKGLTAEPEESMLSLTFQVFVPFLIAGFGTVGAGLVLDMVQHWEVFRQITEVFILVPALLGLKGNLEMTLASRLSTQANLGNLETAREQWLMASGNIALIQCQATVVGFLAALFAIVMDWLPEGDFNLNHALLLCASSLLTASIASFILGLVMIAVVILSHKCNLNPDNLATPIAASLGDLTTLALLAQITSILFYTIDTSLWLCSVVIFIYLLLIPVWTFIAKNNKYTRQVLYTGWTPVISAMAISSVGGVILDFAVSRFKGIAVFQPVINGVGGNLVAVQASRISTYLHRRSKLGLLPKSDAQLCLSPCSTFFADNIHARTAKILLLMVVPGHLIFTFGIRLLQAGHTSVTPLFLVVYLSAAVIQVILLLYFAHIMILWMWKRHIDPDNSAIPYLTALGDLLGTALLAAAFLFLFTIGDRDADVGD